MKHIKDFFYDKNDIFIALIILVLAAALIFWRMDVIMDYPQTLAESNTATAEEAAKPSDEGSKPAAPSASIWADGMLTQDVTVTVQGGTATVAVQSLIDAGLFDSYDQFTQVCSAAGYSADQIKATTFTFTAGSTQTDIAKQVTV